MEMPGGGAVVQSANSWRRKGVELVGLGLCNQGGKGPVG